jgi:hypothetical protein
MFNFFIFIHFHYMMSTDVDTFYFRKTFVTYAIYCFKHKFLQWLIKAMRENKLSCSHNLLFCSHKKDILFPQHDYLVPTIYHIVPSTYYF